MRKLVDLVIGERIVHTEAWLEVCSGGKDCHIHNGICCMWGANNKQSPR